MNYPKIGPIRVFAMGKDILIVAADGGKPFTFNPADARELAKALNVLADAIDPKEKKTDG